MILNITSSLSGTQRALLSLPLLALLFALHRHSMRNRRQRKIPPMEERVLVLGASSGVGRELAIQYARRGAYVCLVARSGDVEGAKAECIQSSPGSVGENGGKKEENRGARMIAEVADFSKAEDMVRVRDKIISEWGRLDTLAVIAGISSLKPLLETAGIERIDGDKTFPDAGLDGIQTGVNIAGAALQGNIYGPLVAGLTFVPLLARTSPSPSVLLLSSLAAVVPAPTRALYAATKSASLLLYQSLSIEHPSIHFTSVLPSTIEGSFRASAVDAGTVREADPNRKGLKRTVVATRSILAVDRQERDVFMQGYNRIAPTLYYILCPGIIERIAKKKYNYS